MTDYAALYRESRERIAALVREAGDEQRARYVPACPKWTVSDTVAHLAAVATDALAGHSVATISAEEHTAVQVEQRQGRTLEEVLGEWDSAAGPIEQALAAQQVSPLLVHDVLTHEADIRGALGAGRPPEAAWSACLQMAPTVLSRRLGHLGRLTILAGDHRFTAGAGEPATTLEVDPYELWRSLQGRRSRAQMQAWKWSGDPEPYLQAMPVFGPTEVPLPNLRPGKRPGLASGPITLLRPHEQGWAAATLRPMAADIVPIELSVTAGDMVTLWAPRWREDGEEWEAFLGDDENLFAFTDVAALVAFVRTAGQHDLVDHPAWSLVPRLPAADLRPADSHRYDLVGVPELVAQPPDTWVIGELADVVSIVRSVAEVCGLDKVHEVLDSTPGFAMLTGGTLAFGGRDGARQWDALCEVVAQRWDEVLDAVDAMVRSPDVDTRAHEAAATELSESDTAEAAAEQQADLAASATGTGDDPALAFWSEVGIDPIRIISELGDHYTLRCYVDDTAVFLGRNGRIDVFASPRALIRHLVEHPRGHDLDLVSTWPQVAKRAADRELAVAVDVANSYVLAGLADDLAGGPETVDPGQLELAVELITDAEQWAGSDAADKALASSEPLGWLVSFLLRPDPTRLAPSPPFDAEVAAWRLLVGGFEDRLQVH